MLVTLILIAALLAGASVLLVVQRNSARSADVARSSMSGLYCAEAGLAMMRPIIAAHHADWRTDLPHYKGKAESAWMDAYSFDIDGDAGDDIFVTIQDNLEPDEDETQDTDLQVMMKVRCDKNAETRTEVAEMIKFTPGSQPYSMQAGGGNEGMNAN